MIMNLTEVTCWYKKVDDDYKYNHFDYGHLMIDKPKPKVSNSVQDKWCKSEWKKEYCYIIDNYKIVKD